MKETRTEPVAAPRKKKAKKSAGRPSNHRKRREELITKATRRFNERGISGTSLGQLAEEIGIARASIYHYIDSRTELVFQCYNQSCLVTAKDLDMSAKAENGLERVIAFINLTLTPDRPAVAVLTEVNSLDPEIASVICDMNNANMSRLAMFLEDGYRDGSIRQCDSTVVSHAIGGMLAWAQLLPLWTYKRRASDIRARARDTLVDLLTHGLAIDRETAFECKLSATDLEDQFTNIFDPDQAAAMKLQSVLKTASRLFNRNGVEAISIDQIAETIGVTKGVLYHYFEDKSDLITQCYERSFELYDRFIDAANSINGSALDIVQTNTHLNIQAQTGNISPLMPQPGFGSLYKATRERLTAKAKQQNQALARILDSAIADGVARECRSELVTHICAGAIGWIPKWLTDKSAYGPFEIADKISSLLRFGLKAE